MFSFSSKPLKYTSEIEENIDFLKLIRLIRNHPNKDVVLELTTLRNEGHDVECRNLKKSKLPWLTPNCLLRKRIIDNEIDFNQNFIKSSGYIYFDIDKLSVIGTKEEFIVNYGHISSLISKSVTGRGISILVRINRKIDSKEDYFFVYEYIKKEYFPLIKFDDSVKNFGCAWILPYDQDVFVNYESQILIPPFLNINKGSRDVYVNTPPHIRGMTPSLIENNENEICAIDEIKGFEKHVLETKIDFDGHYCIRPTLILSIRFPRIILDGLKHKVFRKVTHDFLYLNPNVSLNSTIRFIHNINIHFAKPQMEYTHLKGVVKNQYEYIKKQIDYRNQSPKSLRVIHYSNRNLIPKTKRQKFSNQMRGVLSSYSTWKRIQNAINYLLDEHYTFTQTEIGDLLGIGKSTIKRHIRNDRSFYSNRYDILIFEIESSIIFFS